MCLTASVAALTTEHARGDRLEVEVNRALAETAELRTIIERERQAREAETAACRKDLESARSQLQTVIKGNDANGEKAVQDRLQSLSSHLEAKQRQIDVLRSEKSALEQRLQEALIMHSARYVYMFAEARFAKATYLIFPSHTCRVRQVDGGGAKRASIRLKPLTSNRVRAPHHACHLQTKSY